MKLSVQILLAFTIVLLLSVVDTGSNYLLSSKVKSNTEFLNKSQEIIRNSGVLHKSIIEMQSSFRGYLLTLDTNFLDGYKNGLQNIPGLFEDQRDLIKANKEQLKIFDSIKTLHLQWIHYADTLIESRKKASEVSLLKYNKLFETKLKKQVGKKINDEISELFASFEKIEYRIRKSHSNNLISSIKRTHALSFIFFGLTIILGIASTVYIVSLISKRIKTMVNLAENISLGRFTTLNDTRKDELTSLSVSLNTMSESLNKNMNELRRRNDELDKFAYVVSHDLKAPLRGIHNVVKWIEEDLGGQISPEMNEYLAIITQRTKRMEDLINGLLDFARIREKTAPVETDVQQLVTEIADAIVPRSFKVDVQHLPVIVTERLKLEQVFTNLISNAVKYSSGENGIIVVSCKEMSHQYLFSVKDNGIGIEAEYHGKIFEMFQTLREKHEKESTGIGLAIIKKILEDQHCTIQVISALGQGAEFIFTWPK